uniref:Uncharacterized protein n=1 Tax=Marseillevirus LCMAC102 TaxID=2506603 RepID=A0A481YTG6_9VIRU|nr:MAG: hypothetical protein LCMAC102_00110 [Marseillevirus LCMAC102]
MNITKFKNETLPELMTEPIQIKIMCLLGVPLSPVVQEELAKPTAEGRKALVAKLQAQQIITETSVKGLRDACIKANDGDLRTVISACNKFEREQGGKEDDPVLDQPDIQNVNQEINWKDMNLIQFLKGRDEQNFLLTKIALERYYNISLNRKNLLLALVIDGCTTVKWSSCYNDEGEVFLKLFENILTTNVIKTLERINDQEPLIYIKSMITVYEAPAREAHDKKIEEYSGNSELTVYVAAKLEKLGKSSSDVGWIIEILEKEDYNTLQELKEIKTQHDVDEFITNQDLPHRRKITLRAVLNPEG